MYSIFIYTTLYDLIKTTTTPGALKIIEFMNSLPIWLMLFLIVMILVGRYLLYPYEISFEQKNRSVLTLNKYFPEDENPTAEDIMLEVIPVNAPDRYYTFLVHDLPKLGTFYATSSSKKSPQVKILFKYNDSENNYYCLVDYLKKEKFTYYYELKE